MQPKGLTTPCELKMQSVAEPGEQVAARDQAREAFVGLAKAHGARFLFVEIGELAGQPASAFLIPKLIHQTELQGLRSAEHTAISKVAHHAFLEAPALGDGVHELAVAGVDQFLQQVRAA